MAGALHLIIIRPWLLLLLFCILSGNFFHTCYGQSQNIETFFPFPLTPTPAPAPVIPISPYLPPVESPPPEPQQPLPLPLPEKKSNDNSNIAKAAAATAASTLVVCAVVFFFVQRCIVAKRRRKISGGVIGAGANNNSGSRGSRRGQPAAVSGNEFERYDGNLKGFIVDEDGLDVLYWRKLEAKNSKKKSFKKEALRNRNIGDEIDEYDDGNGEGTSRENELPLFRGRSSTSDIDLVPEGNDRVRIGSISRMMAASKGVEINPEPVVELSLQSSGSSPPPHSPPPTPPPLPMKAPAVPLPPPPPPVPAMKGPGLPPPPPPKPKSRSLNALSKPEPKGVKLKPLHWDKVNTNHEHSMVWDKIDKGSFRFDGDLMEALFGTVATNRKSPERGTGSSSQICILDERKSQNFAIVIKSLTISIEDILDVLNEGRGLSAENLEKLARIAPTEEEIAQILAYNEDPTRLADAECFLYHILKAVPSAFTRLNAMHFRHYYDQEIVQLKESLQTIELGCKELRTRGLFMKLLEAILKAGNRMNAGTSRGNAQAFKLSSLRKLSDVRSSDGKTTLLHFVVEEVVRSEGKRGVLNRNHSLSRSGSGSQSSNGNMSSEQNVKSKEDREKEYMMLGLPVVGGISSEFSNVKKAATIDYDGFGITCSALTKRAAETRELVLQCEKDGGGRFVFEMNDFLEDAEEELKAMAKEQSRVMEFVKTTTEYYQGGASKEKGSHPFQLFVVVKDFLGMVDQACVEISRNVQRRKAVTASSGTSTSPDSPPSRNPVKFPVLPKNFMSGASRSNSSGSDNDV
ncbi:formin-like protein 8 [Rosa rugosa]|uniref:formin-like protein 8 n=1 Tax=Rosa rugosa TaxID=74645 RepID=UPI002B4009A0|nr:formin-like protein 8 [Rosa rugosa]